jgi:hypothetical protein
MKKYGDAWPMKISAETHGPPDLDDIDCDSIDGSSEIDAYDPDEGHEACLELRLILKNFELELEIMSYDELKAKVREHLKTRLKAIGNRIAVLCSSLPSDSQ